VQNVDAGVHVVTDREVLERVHVVVDHDGGRVQDGRRVHESGLSDRRVHETTGGSLRQEADPCGQIDGSDEINDSLWRIK